MGATLIEVRRSPYGHRKLLLDNDMLALSEVRRVDYQAIRHSKLFIGGSHDVEPEDA